METQHPNTIWTIGHSSMSIDQFLGLLRTNGIDVVIDVRTAPYSRFASQFNKPDLMHVLDRAGVGYRYEGKHLGGRPDDPTCYRSGSVPDHAERADFLKLVDYEVVKRKEWFQQALEDVIRLSAQQRVALMCSEEDPKDCHRHRLIASALVEQGVEVTHIRRDGSKLPAAFSEDAKFVQPAMF